MSSEAHDKKTNLCNEFKFKKTIYLLKCLILDFLRNKSLNKKKQVKLLKCFSIVKNKKNYTHILRWYIL